MCVTPSKKKNKKKNEQPFKKFVTLDKKYYYKLKSQ